jgi:hypothetical protein
VSANINDYQVFSENIAFGVRKLAASPYSKHEGVWGIRIYVVFSVILHLGTR